MKLAQWLFPAQDADSVDAALLCLRLMAAGSLLYHHGLDKIPDWHVLVLRPANDPIGIGAAPSLAFALVTDALCSVLLLVGLATRLAALLTLVTLCVVMFGIDHILAAPYWPVPHRSHGELVWVYAAAYVALLLAGAGRFSVDARLARQSAAAT